MKIFVAYGYNNRDKWIPDLVFPLINAFGDQVVTGENIQGQEIPPAVQRKIQQCNALMAFATRRKKSRNGWVTHRWITDELALAVASNLPVVEIRETGVDDQGGIAGGRQRITYDENERDKCLVEIAKTLGNWHSRYTVEMQLLPDECVRAVRPLLRNPRFRCTYQILDDGVVGNEIKAEILPKPGGLFVRAENVSHMSAIQIRIECAAKSWSSDFSSVEYVGIHLRKE
jgi:hypothetical protein